MRQPGLDCLASLAPGECWIVSGCRGVQTAVIVRKRAGKAYLLALTALTLNACDGGTPFAGGSATVSQAAVGDAQARAFYEARQWRAAWDDKSQKLLLKAIDGASAHGLKPSLFIRAEALPKDRTERELALTSAALRYADALARGYSDPKKLNSIYTVPRPKADIATGLARAIEDGNLGEYYQSLAPHTDEYRALSREFQDYVRQTAAGRPASVPDGKVIEPGSSDSRIPLVAAALKSSGYANFEGVPASYGSVLVEGVRRLQADYGLKVDGIIGGDTLDALNAGPSGRARQLAVAMERLRWLDRTPAGTRIDVNTAAAFLDYWRDGRLVDTRNVVVGEPGWETPQLGPPLFQLVANPYWRVPDSIYEDELAEKGPGYFASQNMQFRDGRLVQLPGPKNALGQVKFDLKNDNAIYLHDTPAKALFADPERHRSHGCVRVHNALEFAMMIAGQDGVIEKFRKGLASGKETYVKLTREIPVRLLYHTAFFDGSRVRFRPDVYGWDDEVAQALGLDRGPPRRKRQHQRGDVGP